MIYSVLRRFLNPFPNKRLLSLDYAMSEGSSKQRRGCNHIRSIPTSFKEPFACKAICGTCRI